MGKVRRHTVLRDEQTRLATFLVVPDLDMAGTRRLPCRFWRRSKHGRSKHGRATLFTDSSHPIPTSSTLIRLSLFGTEATGPLTTR